MTTISTGLQLIRNFGNGENLRKVITEVIDGKILTKVLNSEGTLLAARTKTISSQVVGDKFVRTVTKELAEKQPHPILGQDTPFYWGSKTVTDRIYRANNIGDSKKLGERIVYYNRGASDTYHRSGVLKRDANGFETYTRFGFREGNNRFDKVIVKNAERDNDYYNQMRNGLIGEGDYYINYNNLGLPVPYGVHGADPAFTNKSLKEMVDIHYNIHPERNYLPNDSGLQNLNRLV